MFEILAPLRDMLERRPILNPYEATVFEPEGVFSQEAKFPGSFRKGLGSFEIFSQIAITKFRDKNHGVIWWLGRANWHRLHCPSIPMLIRRITKLCRGAIRSKASRIKRPIIRRAPVQCRQTRFRENNDCLS
jgi:hypothetical protein